MIKKCGLAFALMSLAMAVGCAKGGNGAGNGITVKVSVANSNGQSISDVYETQSVTFSAQVTGTGNTAVAWTLSGKACSGNPNPCGTIDGNTGIYIAPATSPNPSAVTITATSRADSTARGALTINVVPVTVAISPATPVSVGHGLVQQFTATAVPDDVAQTFTWTCTQNGAPCANFVSDASGVAVYTAAEAPCNACVTVSAVSSVDPTGCTEDPKDCNSSKVTVVASRLVPAAYAFRFSGYDNSNHPVAVAGTITVSTGGAITGVEDELTSAGPSQHAITGGSYTPSALGDHNNNNAGTLQLTTGTAPNQYQVVLDASGDLAMIESDGSGTGSGIMRQSSTSFNTAAQNFVFGFTGTDASGKRVGYVGVLPLNGAGQLKTGGQLDTNDNGATNSLGCTQPCSVGGSYQYSAVTGLGQLTLTTAVTQHFDFFVASGQTKSAPNPLTLYAISTDAVDNTHPAISGSLVFQDPATTYDKTALNSFSVSNLTGVDATGSNTLVSLVNGSGDGSSTISQTFDSNNAGMIVAAASSAASCPFTVGPNAAGVGGRYVITFLGTGSGCTSGIPFVFYASGANRGFLLDQSSAAVMAGGMDPQDANVFAPSQLPGTYAAFSVTSATPSVLPFAANLVLTSLDTNTHDVGGTEYPGAQTVTGTYTLNLDSTGTIALTAPAAASYVIYATDASHFEMINVDSGAKNPVVIFAQQ